MNDLQTLNDIAGAGESIGHYIVRVRQEAIKWVKEGLTEKKNSGTINWIIHFFNLTEEDLK